MFEIYFFTAQQNKTSHFVQESWGALFLYYLCNFRFLIHSNNLVKEANQRGRFEENSSRQR